MPNTRIYTASRIFTGTQWISDHAIIVDNAIISDVVQSKFQEGITSSDNLYSALLTAEYGAGGKLFHHPRSSYSRLQTHLIGGTSCACHVLRTSEVVYQCMLRKKYLVRRYG